jgi:hypothetical protein
MSWREDALCVLFAQMKNDQLGTRPRDPRHLYANPHDPEISCVLALGIYFLCTDTNLESKFLFPGEKQYDRYQKILKKVYSYPDVAQYLQSKGVNPDKLGTHSTRKGAATYVSSGTTAAPSAAAVCLRAGWSIDGVTQRYLRYDQAGDQHCGRTVSGLPVNSALFAYLPPRFKSRPPEVDNVLRQCFPRAPPTMMGILEYCIASIVYHSSFLRKHLSSNHPLFNTPLFRDTTQFTTLQGAVVCEIGDGTQELRPTGIPPYVEGLVKIERVAALVQKVCPEVIQGVNAVLEQRAIDAGSITRTTLADILGGMFQKEMESLLAKLTPPQQQQPMPAIPK